MVKFKNGELKNRPAGIKMMLVARAVYAWFHGETPDNKDICHKDDNPDNNHIDNLEALSHGENIRNRKIKGACKYRNYYTVNGLVKENE